MMRANINLADAVVKRTIRSGENTGDESLFPPMPKIPHKTKAIRPVAQVVEVEFDVVEQLRTPSDFATLRAFKTRTTCPMGGQSGWASLVKMQTTHIVNAIDNEERDKHMLRLLCLPTLFLPAAVPSSRVIEHLQSRQSFTLNDRKGKDNTEDHRERLAKTITRFANDGRLKEAVKILHQTQDDVPYEEKLRMLQKKFLPHGSYTTSDNGLKTRMFTPAQVVTALKRMPKSSATAIDGWTQRLWMQALLYERSIAEDLGVICAMILNQGFGERVMEMLKAGRAVGIPKKEGGIRPIVVSSSLLKLCGSLCMMRAKVKVSKWQYAISVKYGCERIVHEVRKAYGEGKAIIRLDMANAFNVANRQRIADILQTGSTDLLQYFKTVYGKATQLFVFGSNGQKTVIESCEGVRQGDSTSSLFFCQLLDIALAEIASEAAGLEFALLAYMDDLSIVCQPTDVATLCNIATTALTKVGMEINVDKSQVLCHSPLGYMSSIRQANMHQSFKIVGGCVNEHYEQYNTEIIDKTSTFFQKLKWIDIHPQIKFNILRFCGGPRLIYAASIHPTEAISETLRWFDEQTADCLQDIVGGNVAKAMVHDRLGAGIPNYVDNAHKLYNASVSMTRTQAQEKERVELVTNSFDTAAIRSQHQAAFLFYNSDQCMTPAQFRVALGIRLRTCPASVRIETPTACKCGHTCTSKSDFIEHAIGCKDFSSFSKTSRHNMVVDALCRSASRFGINTCKEPRWFSYECPEQRRPDITFLCAMPIVTDVTIVNPHTDTGVAAKEAATKKDKIHDKAVAGKDMCFFPFAMETYGHMDEGCTKMISAISKQLPVHLQFAFRIDMVHAASTALAKARVLALLCATNPDYVID